MPRSLSEAQEALLRKLIREGYTTRAIAESVGCGTGTVTRRKNEMGMEIRAQTSQRVTRLLAVKPARSPNMLGGMPPNLDKLPKNSAPSAAALRLAEFDPIIRRAISRPIEEDADDEE